MKTNLKPSPYVSSWRTSLFLAIAIIILCSLIDICRGQDKEVDEFGDPKTSGADSSNGDSGSGGAGGPPKIPKQVQSCDGIYISYDFLGREKEYPHVKNTTAQSWAFKAQLQLVNMGSTELKTWKVFVGFQHRELLVSAEGAVLVDGDEFPAQVGVNGTTIGGYPQADLKTSIDTAGDFSKISAKVGLKGTLFGVKPPATPCLRPLSLQMMVSSAPLLPKADKKFKANAKVKYSRKKKGDLNIMYDILQAYGNNYLGQVTMDNDHPLGRLDHWNLTWEWMRGEFIYSMKGAYTHLKDPAQCIYGPAEDEKVGKLPYCCRNGTVLPKTMNESESRTMFQLQVFKLPPDLNRTALYPPQNWKLTGVLNPDYKCGPPMRVEASEFPDPSGLQAKVMAVASWQVVCNITRPKEKQNRCCVSFSAYYNDSVVPCNTCACGCNNLPEGSRCSTKAPAMLVPPEALLVPFDNRTLKAVAWSKIKHYPMYTRCPALTTAGLALTGMLMLIIKMGKASEGYNKAYSFNGTLLKDLNNTIFVQGLKGLNYLIAETNGSKPSDPRVPGKQQSVLSFSKKLSWHLNIRGGDGFPQKLLFTGKNVHCLISFLKRVVHYDQCP
ncbi:COBRA-like protein 10 [Bienertia sinuspersici]